MNFVLFIGRSFIGDKEHYGFHGYTYKKENIGKHNGKQPGSYVHTVKTYVKTLVKSKYKQVIPELYIEGYGGLNTSLSSIERLIKDLDITIENLYLNLDSKIGLIPVKKHSFLVNIKDKELVRTYVHTEGLGNQLSHSLSQYDFDDLMKVYDNSYNFWKRPKVLPTMLENKRLLCLPNRSSSNRLYEMVTYKEDVFLGTPKESSYVIIDYKEPIPLIEDLKAILEKSLDGVERPYFLHLDTINSSKFSQLYDRYGLNAIKLIAGKSNYLKLDDVMVGEEDRINGIMTQAFDKLDILRNELLLEEDTGEYLLRDITDSFFNVSSKGGYVIDPEITMAVNIVKLPIEVDGRNIPVPIHMGYDIANRNLLKRLEKEIDSVTLVLKKYDVRLSYNTIVKLKDGKRMIYSSINRNNIFFKTTRGIKERKLIIKTK